MIAENDLNLVLYCSKRIVFERNVNLSCQVAGFSTKFIAIIYELEMQYPCQPLFIIINRKLDKLLFLDASHYLYVPKFIRYISLNKLKFLLQIFY